MGERLFEPGVTDGRSSFAGLCSFQPGLRRCRSHCLRVLRRSWWSKMWSYRNAPAGPAKSPSRGSVCIVTLIAKKVKLFFPARQPSSQPGSRSFPRRHSERSEESVSSPGQILRRSRQRLQSLPEERRGKAIKESAGRCCAGFHRTHRSRRSRYPNPPRFLRCFRRYRPSPGHRDRCRYFCTRG